MTTRARATAAAPAPAARADDTGHGRPLTGWRLRLYTIIFEADTRAGRAFDIALIWLILISIAVVVLDSVASLARRWSTWFEVAEWTFTLLFTAEYLARLVCVRRPWRYACSFYGVVDLLAILPTYLAVLVPGLHLLIDVRVLRLLRVARIFKLSRYAAEARHLAHALAASGRKIAVFLGFVMMVVLVMGTLMYVVEGPGNGYTSIADGDLLGDHDDDHRGLRRHHAQDRPGPADRLADDAAGLGRAGGAHGHRHRRDEPAPR